MLIDDSHSNRKTVPKLTRAGRGQTLSRLRARRAPRGRLRVVPGGGCNGFSVESRLDPFQSNPGWFLFSRIPVGSLSVESRLDPLFCAGPF